MDSSGAASLALDRLHAYLFKKKWPAVFFGGLLRDAILNRGLIEPRDIDIVVETRRFIDLEKDFQSCIRRKTRFGGLVLEIEGVKLDVWPLDSTWGFTANLVQPASFENLPSTALLSIEAVTLDLESLATRSPIVHEKGFFASVSNQTIDLNLAENPFPALSIVRTIVIAEKYALSLSRRLSTFLIDQRRRITQRELTTIQRNHYGKLIHPAIYIEDTLNSIEAQLRSRDVDAISIGPLPHMSE